MMQKVKSIMLFIKSIMKQTKSIVLFATSMMNLLFASLVTFNFHKPLRY